MSNKYSLNIQKFGMPWQNIFANKAANEADFNGITVGISYSGIEELKKDIKYRLTKEAYEKLDDLSNVRNTFTNNWHGDDCEAFLKNLEALKENIKSNLEEYANRIDKEFDNLEASWEEFQKNNVEVK